MFIIIIIIIMNGLSKHGVIQIESFYSTSFYFYGSFRVNEGLMTEVSRFHLHL